MPFGINKHSNRSQQALETSQGSVSGSSSLPAGEPQAYDPRTGQPLPYSQQQAHDLPQQYLQTNIPQDGEPVVYQDPADVPVRSQSQRYTTGYHPAPSPPPPGDTRLSFSDDQRSTDIRKSYSLATNPRLQPPVVEQKKSKSSRFFSGFSSKAKASDSPSSPAQSSQSNFAELGRRISKRHRDKPELRTHTKNTSVEGLHQQQDWQSSQSSEQLPSPPEVDEDDSGLDPYLIREQTNQPPKLQTVDPNFQTGNHFARPEQDNSVRLVNENLLPEQYQQQPHLTTQLPQLSQRAAQQQQHQISQTNTPISPHESQPPDFQLQSQQAAQYQVQSSLVPGTNSTILQYRSYQNPEVVSQFSHDSPVEAPEEQRPSSVQGAHTLGFNSAQEYSSRTTAIQGPRPLVQQSAMAPPPTQGSQSRKAVDVNKSLQGDGRGPPPAYSAQQYPNSSQHAQQGQQGQQGQQQQSGSNPLPPLPSSSQGSTFRGSSALQREYGQGNNGEQGRSTPPLTDSREMTDMDRLILKYKKVKGLYFEKQAQVEQLQNTLANQRMSQSRTSLDDNEYATRFSRLDGAIKEIAFSIRKDWKQIPRWLLPYVNQDAQKVGTKEMTAVGRAFISRWIVDEIFGKCFHPGLDAELSAELKRIEENVRHGAPPANNQEESDALTAKIVQWRLTTVEGLSSKLFSAQTTQSKADFSRRCVTNLTAQLINHLQDSASQGIEGNATSIVELSVGIASHLPLESRDICLTYPLPGEPVQSYMKVEQALPPLDNPGRDTTSEGEGTTDVKELTQEEKSKNNPSGSDGKRPSISSGSGEPSDHKGGKDGGQKVRFAGFFGVEVRGRQWLINPPVWTVS